VKALNTGTDPNGTPIPAGRRIALVPRNMFSLWNRYEVGGGWALGLGIVHQDDSFASISNTVTLPSFTRADGAVYYTFAGGRTRVALNVENLADRHYFPTADGDNNLAVGAPRTARLTLTSMF
jgi:catecholate siderophore receptor